MAGKKAKNNEVGQALLKIVPSLDGFIKDLSAKLKASQPSWPKGQLDLELKDGSLAKIQAEIEAWARKGVNIEVEAKTSKAEAEIERTSRDRRTNVRVDAETAKAEAEIEAMRARQKARSIDIDLDVDTADLDRVIASLRSERDILSDIAVIKHNMEGLDGRALQAHQAHLRSLNNELDVRNKLVRAARASGTNDAGAGVRNVRDIEAAYKALGRLDSLKRDLFEAERNHNEGLAADIRKQIQLKQTMGRIIEDIGDREKRNELDAVKSNSRRRAMLRSNADIQREMGRARERDDRRALGRLRAEQAMRRAEGMDSKRRSGIMMNVRGITLFNLPNITAAVAGVGSLVAALGGVVAAAGAAATALGAMGAVIGVGAGRVFSAFGALKSASSEASSGAQAADRYRDALENVDRAQRSVGDSVRDLSRAQDELGRSYQKASREIRDQNMELQDAALSQEQAAIGVARARQNLARTLADRRAGKASGLDVQEAQLGVRQSQASLRAAQYRMQDTRTDTAVMNAKGIEGSDTVQGAKEARDQAQERVADALRDVARAQRELAKSSESSGGAVDEFNKAMAKLSPNARTFVNAVRSFGPAWSQLRGAVENKLFENLGSTFTRVAKNQLPELQRGLVVLAGTLNGVLDDSLRTIDARFTEYSQNGTFDAFLSSVSASFSGFTSTLDGVVVALTELMIRIGPSLGEFFDDFGTFLRDGAAMWGDFGAKTVDGLGRLLPMFNQFSSILLPVAEIVLPALEQALGIVLDRLSTTEIEGTVQGLATAFVSLVNAAMPLIPPLLVLVELFADFIASIPPEMLTAMIGGFIALKTAMFGLTGVSNSIMRVKSAVESVGWAGEGLQKLIVKFPMLGKVASALMAPINLVKRGLVSLFATMMANPIFLVIAAVAALVAGLVWFFTQTETGKKIWDKVWNGIKNAVSWFINWLKTNWPVILAILTGPIGVAVLMIVRNWDKIKNAFSAAIDFIKRIWDGLVKTFSISNIGAALGKVWEGFKDAFKNALKWIVGLWNKFADKVGFKIPHTNVRFGLPKINLGFAQGGEIPELDGSLGGGKRAKTNIAPGGFVVNAAATKKHRPLLESMVPGGKVIKGPGTGTSDSITGVHGGEVTSAVSAGEFYAPPEYGNLFGTLAAINGGGVSPDGTLYAPGGAVAANAYSELGAKKWNDQWLNYFHNYTPMGKRFNKDAIDGTPQPGYELTHRMTKQRRDEEFQKWLNESGNRQAYSSGGLPPGVTLESIRQAKQAEDDKAAQKEQENVRRRAWAGEREEELKQFNSAWHAYFESHGGNANRDAHLAANPSVNSRYRSGQFPPGDGRRVRPLIFDPEWGQGGLDDPIVIDFSDDGGGGVVGGGDQILGADGAPITGGDGDNLLTGAEPITNSGGGPSGPVEPYGLPPGTNTGGYGSSGDAFPQWVHDIEAAHGMKASTYPGHQESNRSEPGFAPNPQGLNRGIDWVGTVDAMDKFAHWLLGIAPNNDGLEMVIWRNPNTGKHAGWFGNGPDTDGSTYVDDYGGHENHVHTRQSTSFSDTPTVGTVPDDGGTAIINDDGTVSPGGLGSEEMIPGSGGGSSSTGNEDKGIVPSTAIADAEIGGVFSPKRFAQNVGSKAIGATYDALLTFFGLESSILSEDHEYWKAIRDAKNELDGNKDGSGSGSGVPNTPDVGSGEQGDPGADDLLSDYTDPNADPITATPPADPTVNALPMAGSLTTSSSQQEVAAVIAGEAERRGFKPPTEPIAMISTGLQESGLSPTAIGGGGAWHGIFQQDTSYPGRDDPNTNITAFLERMQEKTQLDPSSDIWKRIFWLQQAPAYPTAEAAYQNGRQAYLTEIQSQEARAKELYDSAAKFHTGGHVSGKKMGKGEVEAILLDDEYVINPDSTGEAGPLLEFINASPGNARAAMDALAGPAGAAVNSVAPGAGALVSAGVSAAAGAVESGLEPVAAAVGSFLSDRELAGLAPRPGVAHVQTENQNGLRVEAPSMAINHYGDNIAYDTNKLTRKMNEQYSNAYNARLRNR